ncbi:MAG TPA: LTA synthase family protein, partial [Phaeodactylibacter sp.]|nr:LTA synthase family protein [Phaeodactylibacter sp.]
PSLIRDLKQYNYKTTFYYGGDINFANMKSYLLQSGMEKIIDKRFFPSEEYNAKWGVHDHFVFEKLLADIKTADTPFFKILLSLSSHPPFDTPIPTVISGNDDNSLFANAANYSDKALGDFIKKLKKTKQWNHTIILFVADHGIPYLDNCSVSAPVKYHIPMLWLGGTLKDIPQNVTKISSQTDIANTLLSQLNQGVEAYKYSKNIFSPTSKSFCFYTFNHGFGFLGDSTTHIYNYSGNRFLKKEGRTYPDSIGHAYLQKVSEDFGTMDN